MEWLSTAILGIIIIYCIYWYGKQKSNYWKDRGFPHAKSYPYVGNTWNMLCGKKYIGEFIQGMYDQFRDLKYVGFIQLMKPVLLVTDPELINLVIIKDFSHFEHRGFLINEDVEPINANLANIEGEKWRNLRYKLAPTFTSGKLKAMFEQIVHGSDTVLKYVREKGEPFEARGSMQKFNLSVIGSVAFGLDIDCCKEDEETEKFLEFGRRFFAPSVKQMLKFLMKSNFPKLADYFRMKLTDSEVEEFFTNLVTSTVQYRLSSGQRRNDFLQLMLDLRAKELSGQPETLNDTTVEKQDEEDEPEDRELIDQMKHVKRDDRPQMILFTDKAILAQSFLFIAGGSETTAAALGFGLYHLAANSRVQTKLQDEVDAVLSGQEFTYRAVKEMTYLDHFIDEVLRLNPPNGVLQRACTKDYKIPGTDLVIEKGVFVMVPIGPIQKDPQYFPDPETFDPDRFGEHNTVPKGTYLPFGDGPRSCIANRLALLEMKIFLARLLMKYSIHINEKTQLPLKMLKTSLFQHVEGGIWIDIKDR